MIASVYLFTNEFVMCFDEHGEQIAEMQGRWEDVYRRVLDNCDSGTLFFTAWWGVDDMEITQEAFAVKTLFPRPRRDSGVEP